MTAPDHIAADLRAAMALADGANDNDRRRAMTLVDLSHIPDVVTRWRVDTDFQIAQECRQNATRLARTKSPGWRFSHRLELRRAIRFWQHYKTAVRTYHG